MQPLIPWLPWCRLPLSPAALPLTVCVQADYLRDPTKLSTNGYKSSQLAILNNEGATPNPDYKVHSHSAADPVLSVQL